MRSPPPQRFPREHKHLAEEPGHTPKLTPAKEDSLIARFATKKPGSINSTPALQRDQL